MADRAKIEAKLAEYRRSQEQLTEDYKRQFAALEGAIQAMKILLDEETVENSVPPVERSEA